MLLTGIRGDSYLQTSLVNTEKLKPMMCQFTVLHSLFKVVSLGFVFIIRFKYYNSLMKSILSLTHFTDEKTIETKECQNKLSQQLEKKGGKEEHSTAFKIHALSEQIR